MKIVAKLALGVFIIAGILVVCFVGVSRLLAPAFIKTEISRQVYQLTGRSLEVNGDIRWSFFPWLGIKVQNVVLNNSQEFGKTPLAKADNIQLNVRLMPLFSHRLEVGNILMSGFNLYLVKNSRGQNNWANLLVSSPQKQVAEEKQHHAKFSMLQIDFIQLKDGKISFRDEQNHKRTQLEQVAFSAKSITLNKDFSIDSSFNFKQLPGSLAGDIQFSGMLRIDPANSIFNFSQLVFDSSFKHAQQEGTNIHATGDLIYSSNNAQFSLQRLEVKLNDHVFTGDLAGKLAPTFSAQGHINSTAFLVASFLFENVHAMIGIKNAIVSLNSVTANLYGGHYTGDILINAQPTVPVMTLNGRLKQADAGVLFADLMGKKAKPFTGTLDMSSMLKFTLRQDSIRKTLNGNITVRLQDGVLHGINIPALIQLGQAILKQTTPPDMSNNQTDFGVLTGTFQIHDGVMLNQDLILQSSQLMATGRGEIDLVDNQIDYHLTAGLVGHKTLVPISIRGNIGRPVIAPDTQQMAKHALNEQADKLLGIVAKSGEANKLKEKVGKELEKLNLGALLG